MNWRVLKETVLGLAVIAAVVAFLLFLISPVSAASRSKSTDVHSVPNVVSVDESVFIHVTDEVATLRTEIANIQRELQAIEATGIFRKPSNPEQPENPQTPQQPSQPPQFEFPSTPETEADPASIKDWSPEQWKSFFDTVMYIITAILGLFGGGAAGGLFAKKPVSGSL